METVSNASGQFGISSFTVSAVAGQGAHTSIQSAVTAASASQRGGETIFIYPGTYMESISWPNNLSVEGTSVGRNAYDIVVIGNQTFEGGGNLSIKNIEFNSTSGDTWKVSSSIGRGSLGFQECRIGSSNGKGVSVEGFATLYLRSCEVMSSLQSIDALETSIVEAHSTKLATSTDGMNAVSLSGSASLKINLSNLNTSGLGSGSCISLSGVSNSVDSCNSRYNAGNGARASAFSFEAAGGVVHSMKDEMFIAGGTYWANATGSFGSISYGSIIINTSTSPLIDPQITATPLSTIPDAFGIVWSDESLSKTVSSNTGSVSLAEVTLTLPPSPENGDVCEFILGIAAQLTVAANAGQTLRIGNLVTSIAGNTSSAVLGNALKLVYNSVLKSWLSEDVTGNWVI